MSQDRISIGDIQRSGYCVRGARRWCRDNGVDFRRLVKEGLPISELEQFDDEIVRIVIAKKKAEISDGR